MISETADRVRTALERNTRALELRPGLGQGTAVTQVRLSDGLGCEIEEGPWRLQTDMSPKSGGTGTAPNPGTLGRAAVGSCLATGFAMWAARLGVPFTSLTVDVEADYDARGELGVAPVDPGYSQVRLRVRVETTAPEAQVRELFATVERTSSWLDVVRRPLDVRCELTVSGGA